MQKTVQLFYMWCDASIGILVQKQNVCYMLLMEKAKAIERFSKLKATDNDQRHRQIDFEKLLHMLWCTSSNYTWKKIKKAIGK